MICPSCSNVLFQEEIYQYREENCIRQIIYWVFALVITQTHTHGLIVLGMNQSVDGYT